VTRKLAIPGLAEHAIGMKHVEEAVAIRDRLLTAFDQASALEPGPLRRRLLTVTFVGGGFSGVEGFGELLSLAASLLRSYPEVSPAELNFHLVEARDRILPEVSDRPGRWVVRSLEKRGARVHLDAELVSARNGHVVLSTGEEFDSELIVWTVGNAANPMVRSHTDLPIDQGGMLTVRADLRVGTDAAPVADAWGAVTTRPCPTRPNGRRRRGASPRGAAGKLLARNIVATLRDRNQAVCSSQPRRSPRWVSAAAFSSTAAWSSRSFRLADASRIPRAGRTDLGEEDPGWRSGAPPRCSAGTSSRWPRFSTRDAFHRRRTGLGATEFGQCLTAECHAWELVPSSGKHHTGRKNVRVLSGDPGTGTVPGPGLVAAGHRRHHEDTGKVGKRAGGARSRWSRTGGIARR
jgi:hypothetical protein